MNPIRPASIALLAGALISCTVYAQSPGYGQPPGSQPPYDDNRGYNDDRRHDDPRYDDRGYDDRGYDDRYSPRVDVGFFYEELSPYGDWVYTRDLGWAWFPRDVRPYWRPYTDGRWVVTEYGWTWVSYEPYGWATYHYGRWAWDSRFGWLWVPGTIWGPAWVSWQHGGGYVGWAPLPPTVGFQVGIGLQLGGFNLSIGIRPDAYSFVPERSFLEPRLSGYMVPTARNVTIIHNTTNITNYTYIDNRVVNRGVEVAQIERVTGRHLQRLRVADAREKTRTEVAASEVRIYRPGKQKLDAVRVGARANAGQREDTEPRSQDRTRPSADRRDRPEVVVAPRVVRAPQPDTRKFERQERSAQQELQRYQAQEKQKLDKLQSQEVAKVRAQADRGQVQKNHQAEREALQQQQRDAAQQLEARMKAQREAALTKAPGGARPQGDKPAVDPKQGKKKGKGQQQDQEKKQGQNSKPQAPPPA